MKWVLLFIISLPFANPVLAQEFNAGFVQGIWYSEEKIFADQTVRIYVAVRNNTGVDMTGTVEFLDNESRIGSVRVSALSGRIVEQWADWTPAYGEHTLTATLSRTKLQAVGGSAEPVTVTSSLAEDAFFVDYDTDGDGVGNQTDIDDDGDGISDEVEIQNGTDPLQFNTPSSEPEVATENISPEDSTPPSTNNNTYQTNEGLEQYLTPSRADTMLGGITQTINNTKEKIDTYRQARAVANGTADPALIEEIEVNADGFGEITRTNKEERKIKESELQKEENKPKVQKPDGFLGDIFTIIGNITEAIYTGILTTISFALGYPVFMQLLLLFGILYGLYKTAQKMSRRPQ